MMFDAVWFRIAMLFPKRNAGAAPVYPRVMLKIDLTERMDYALTVYVIFNWSPLVTGTVAEKAAVDHKVPVVPLFVLTLVTNTPYTVSVPLILNVAGLAFVVL